MIEMLLPRSAQFLSAVIVCLAILFSLQIGPVSALNCDDPTLSTQQAIQCGANGAAGQSGDPSANKRGLEDTITKLVNTLSVVVGIIAVIMVVIGGFRYITSGGDATRVGNAKNTILYAIIGLVIVALAQVIVKFVIGTAT